MKQTSKKILVLFSIILAIFSISLVNKQFQNDTFFYITIGEHILEHGIDMQEHFSWISGLSYTFSHWAFDIVIYLIYQISGLSGIYISIILLTIIINITLFILLYKRTNSAFTAIIVTLTSSYIIKECFAARSQIISFLCFIIEIYCIEKFIETNKKIYAIVLIILSIIVANFHAATWPLFLVLFMPYVGSEFIKFTSFKNIYKMRINRISKKINKLPNNSPKLEKLQNDLAYNTNLFNSDSQPRFSRIILKDNYNIKNLIILMIIIALTGLLTPIHGVPYTYIINSMLGESNFEGASSIDFINEMMPIIPACNLGILVFIILISAFLIFLPTKLKLEHGFLVLGLLIMTITSRRYVYLLVFLGSYVLADLLAQSIKEFIPDDISNLEKFCIKPSITTTLLIFTIIMTISNLSTQININFVDEKLLPIGAVEYIKENLDYQNIKIFNSYNNGSYLMFNHIPVFIDSRLDVYCSEFNDTDVFRDYVKISHRRNSL